ncbi:MAG TPA: Flp pilus assembly protein CpaB [Symbiobacteriaceae bacterium]|nr:Flp pilus assembly protein CpaB [Symbiobacteriaceae bacterium]
MQPSRLPLNLALIAFALTFLSGSYAYAKIIRTVPALVAVRDLPAGTALHEDMVKVIRVPAGGTPPQALYGPGQVAGMYAVIPLFADQILTARHVSASPLAGDGLAVAPGQRVLSIPVRPEAVLAGALRPGDIVDVAAAWPGADGKPGTVEVLVSAVKVVDLRSSSGQSIHQAKEGPAAAVDSPVPTAALLAVTTNQARTLVGAVESKVPLYLLLVGRDAK